MPEGMFKWRVENTITATAAQVNYLSGVTAGTAQASKAFVFGATNGLTLNRSSGSYGYGMNFDADACFNIAGSAQKSFAVQISGDRASAYAVTGDSNDAILKINGNNYAACDSNFILRGINASINQRSGGTLGRLEHSIGTQNKSGGTAPIVLGLTLVAENYGTCADVFGGADILLKNEGAVATTEFGIRIRNENNSVADAVGAGLLFTDTGANTGYDYLIDGNGASVVVADVRLQNAMVINNDEADRTMIGAVIGICNDASPASNAPASGIVLYFDGTDIKAVDSSGQTATLNNAAFS
jgi:hypothetical protein